MSVARWCHVLPTRPQRPVFSFCDALTAPHDSTTHFLHIIGTRKPFQHPGRCEPPREWPVETCNCASAFVTLAFEISGFLFFVRTLGGSTSQMDNKLRLVCMTLCVPSTCLPCRTLEHPTSPLHLSALVCAFVTSTLKSFSVVAP